MIIQAKNIEKLRKTLMHNKNCLSEVDKIKIFGHLKVYILSATLAPLPFHQKITNTNDKHRKASKNYFVQRICS